MIDAPYIWFTSNQIRRERSIKIAKHARRAKLQLRARKKENRSRGAKFVFASFIRMIGTQTILSVYEHQKYMSKVNV